MITRDRGRDSQEVVCLSLHRSDTFLSVYSARRASGNERTTVTEEDPREGLAPGDLVLEPELELWVVLFYQPEQDTSALKDIVSLASSRVLDIIIYQSWDSSIRVDLEELGQLLLLGVELDIDKVVS